MNRKPNLSKFSQRAKVAALAAFATVLGLPVSAATVPSFPQYPLITGGSNIPPNILLILDDSGSMAGGWMTADPNGTVDKSSLGDSVIDRSYVNNTIYYNPAKTYLPWRTGSLDLNDRLAAADFRSVSNNDTSPTANKIDLTDPLNEGSTYFYVPKAGVSNPGTSLQNYDKYRVTASASSTSYNGGVVQRLTAQAPVNGSIGSVSEGQWSSCIVVSSIESRTNLFISTSGSGNGNVDLYVYSDAACSNQVASSKGGTSSESYTYLNPPTEVGFRVLGVANNSNGVSYSWVKTGWVDMAPSGNTSALQKAELQNFANWYQYHRTRNKMAKAGASEAFGRLGKNYRVGFDTIWNRGAGWTADTGGSSPSFPIPVGTNGGLFSDANRDNFYARLQAAGASGNTPLKGALQRAARYYKTDAPWKDSNGSMLTCRQNYAILTTDGFWNNDSGFTPVGNADEDPNWAYRDGISDTLADVAYKYWSEDMRTDMVDNVRTSGADPANWQHMVTFGVSVGLRGTLDPNLPPPSPWNVDPTKKQDATRIDDLWHAAINGHGSFVVASDTDRFAQALTDALKAIDSRSASGSNIASSSTKTDTTTLTFVAGFTSGSWLGDLIASPFNAGLTGVSSNPTWILSKTFGTGGVNANFTSRKVLTYKGGAAKIFNSTNFGSDSDFAARTGQADAVTAADNVNYILGDQSKELGKVGGTLRKRAYPFGDIVDSSPAYVANTNTVYIGANDGMLHGIDASNGKVLFSYLPKGIDYTSLANLSATAYDHHYFVDGQIDVATIAGNGNNTKNILVGALGRGGRGVFGLDVSSPGSMAVGNVLWDNTTQDSTTDPNMGYVLGPVRIRSGNGGKTYALVPNGIDSPNGSATLYVYTLNANGSVAATTPLVADAGPNNGLMSLGLADLNGDGTVDIVYGGDLKGNVWRWDFSGNSLPTSAVKLFQAKDAGGNVQPITGGIGVGRDDLSGQIVIGFGTGRFISAGDVPTTSSLGTTQSLYGLLDDATTINGRGELQQRTIPYTGTTSDGRPARGFENYSALPPGKKGWYIDFAPPERVISAPTIYGTAMFISSVIPSKGGEGCDAATGSGFLNAINLFTGTSPDSSNGGYLPNAGTVNGGIVGSVGITNGMPTEVNVTSGLVTVGTGAFSSEGSGMNTTSEKLGSAAGGQPRRVNWREIVPLN